ncbi:hypothetical protein IPP75_05185 [Candidatus Saccharibacteria bacterium]|nr:MAG: hypothetical protein IPP75_05185 [Candidatus Saccharibacteria bacterium]
MKQKKKVHNSILKILGGTGYFTVFMEWFWLLALYLPGFFDSELGKTIFPKNVPVEELRPVTTVAAQEPSILLLIGTILLAAVIIGAVFYVVFAKYIPAAAKVTNKVVHVAAERAVPVVAHKPVEKIPARKRKLLTERVLFWVKMILALTPLGIVFIARINQNNVETQIIILGFAFLSVAALMCFVCQTWLLRRWRIPEKGRLSKR